MNDKALLQIDHGNELQGFHMRLFIYEHITGGGLLGAPLPPSLLREGEAMLTALLADLSPVPDLDIVVLRDARLSPLAEKITVHTIRNAEQFDHLFDACLAKADAVWPIAPENDGALESVSQRIQASGKTLLGCTPEAIRVAGSKFETSRLLASKGIPVVPTYRSAEEMPAGLGAVVIKPDDGAGCQDTYYFKASSAAAAWVGSRSPSYVVQPYIAGESRSVSLLCRHGLARILSCNRQRVGIREGAFQFDGTEVNVEEPSASIRRLVDATAKVLPGLWGYVGIDYIDARHGPVVLEINPRLTTSYVGLAQAIGINPARLVLELVEPSRVETMEDSI